VKKRVWALSKDNKLYEKNRIIVWGDMRKDSKIN
jgi:hypothetical protein